MIWLTWRQARIEAIIGGAALAILAIFLLWTGHTINSEFRDAGLPACLAASSDEPICVEAARGFMGQFSRLSDLVGWLNLVPFVIGLLLAAPTVLDLEQGTYRLAWTQSLTRRRWLAGKIGFGLLLSVIVAAGMVALWSWWRGPFDRLEGRLQPNAFDFQGTVMVGYVVFAFSLCLAVGAVLRRAMVTVGIGLVVFLIARVGVIDWVRPRYLDPRKITWDPIDPEPAAVAGMFHGGSWVISQGLVRAGGQSSSALDAIDACGRAFGEGRELKGAFIVGGGDNPFSQCLHDSGFVNQLLYHPASRFWTFQAIETALYLGVSALLLGFTFWWVTRRIV